MAYFSNFSRSLTAIAVAAAAIGGAVALPAAAQSQPAPAATASAPQHAKGPQRHAAPHADHAQRHAQHWERIQTLLQLQPKQQAAWEQYVKAMTPSAHKPVAPDSKDVRALTTPQRLDAARAHRQARQALAEQRDQATRTLYAALNPAQQKAFDTLHAKPHRPDVRGLGHGARHHGDAPHRSFGEHPHHRLPHPGSQPHPAAS